MSQKEKENVFLKNFLIPKHEVLSEEEKQQLLEKYDISIKQLPKIKKDDAAIRHLNLKPGDVVKITRESKTAGVSIYYRCVID